MIEAYPLCWPIGQKRTANPTYSRFGEHTLTKATKYLLEEVERMKGDNPIISSNIPLNKNGEPRADYLKKQIQDKGVAVYFTRNKQQVVLACDRWDNVEDNIWAIACSIEAMRSLERWGVSEMLDRAFSGFLAIPERATGRNCWDILDLRQTKDINLIKEKYRVLLKICHPDYGGTQERLSLLIQAKDEALHFAQQ